MKKSILRTALLIFGSVTLFSFTNAKDWFVAGSKPNDYKMEIEKGTGLNGGNCATIKSIEPKIKGFGTFMQQSKVNEYLGKRIKMTGYVKSTDVKKWAGLWLRIDGSTKNEVLSFDNMQKRAIKGTTDWTKYEIVLDVPSSATQMSFGALIEGTGQIWFDNLSFEIIDDSVKVTSYFNTKPTQLTDQPSNLKFEN